MHLSISAILLAVCATSASAQAVLFESDFETGPGPWDLTGTFHWVAQGDTCASQPGPYPTPLGAMRYGDLNSCNFGAILKGSMTLQTPVALPVGAGNIALRFDSFDQVECDFCGWDWRFVYVSADGGSSWEWLGGSVRRNEWYELAFDLTPWAGQDVLVRLEFDAVDSYGNGGIGWVVDDVRIVVDGNFVARYCPDPQTYLDWSGSLSYADNDFTLHMRQAYGAGFNLFLIGGGPTHTPLGLGYLCIVPTAAGFVRLNPATLITPNSPADRTIDLWGATWNPPLLPGTTWYFQNIYRVAGAGWDFSPALAVTFAP